MAGEDAPPLPRLPTVSPPQGDAGTLAAAELLVNADSPVIIGDRAIHSEAGMALLVDLAEALQAPFVNKFSRMNFPTTHYLNHSMRGGAAVSEADVILGLELGEVWGSVNRMLDLPHRESQARVGGDVKVITLGMGGTFTRSNYQDFDRYYEADLPIVGDVETTLPALPAFAGARAFSDQFGLYPEFVK